MGFGEQRGKFWRARWRTPDGKLESLSGFKTKKAAEKYAERQEALIAEGLYVDPKAGKILFSDWSSVWYAGLDLELSTMENIRYHLESFAIPRFGERTIDSISPEEVNAWEKEIAASYAPRTAKDVRSTLSTCLGDAVPSRISRNPAERGRARGKKAARRIQQVMQQRRTWATPLEAFLVAERTAALSGRDFDFVKVVSIAWTGMRWSETLGLAPGCVHGERWDLDWKLYELNGKFYRGAPKDGSIRTIDIPPFLQDLVAGHQDRQKTTRCSCKAVQDPYCSGGEYVFLTASGSHVTRSDFSRRYFRPATDGWYPKQGGKSSRPALPVLADVTSSWPGVPLPPWPAAVPGELFEPPPASGYQRRPQRIGVNSRSSKADLVAHAVGTGMSPEEAAAMSREQFLDRFVRTSYVSTTDTPKASWLPVMPELTPHGLRHAHETWMAEDRIPDKLRDERMGHVGDGSMRSHYTHVTDRMREELVEALQRRWGEALQGRADLERHWAQDGIPRRSTVGLVNELLEPLRSVPRLDEARSGRLQRTLRARPAPRLLPKTDIG